MDFKCESCGYDLTGVARTRRTDVRCPECGRDNALGVDVSCIRCGYDLSARAGSHLHRVMCSECGEEDAARPRDGFDDPMRRFGVARYIVVLAMAFVISIPALVAVHAAHVHGVAGQGGNGRGLAIGAAIGQTLLINACLGFGVRFLTTYLAASRPSLRTSIAIDSPRPFYISIALSPAVVVFAMFFP